MYMDTIYDKYMKRRLLEVALGHNQTRKFDVTKAAGSLKVFQKEKFTFSVQSEINNNVVYSTM